MSDFLKEALALFPFSQAMRRDLHQHPELGFREIRTGSIVAGELEGLDLEVIRGVGKTGVVANIEGSGPGPTVLLRFDMDALPIQEETGAEYASVDRGVMHACGHDGHTAIGLTVAKLLCEHRAEFQGTAKLCFQPSEEGMDDDNKGGNELMIRDGVLENPRVDKTLALHLWNEKPVGWIGVAAGPVMAGAELFTVKIRGTGGHGAVPHLAIDPVVAAAHLVVALQTIASRNVPPLAAAVVSVTTIHSGTAFNVIPPEAELTGTIRTFDPGVRKTVLDRFEQIARGIGAALGCSMQVDIQRLSPAVINDAAIAASVQDTARTLLPDADLDTAGYLTMGAEDMAFLQEKVSGCYFFVGCSNAARNLNYGHHHPKFDFDELALPRAAALMAASAVDLLRG